MASQHAKHILTVAETRRKASRILPRVLFDYIEGGSDDEITLNENERAFQDLILRPRMGINVEPNLATTILGMPIDMPILLAPMGMVQLVHPDGAVGVARAASEAGIISVLSRTAMCSPAEVSQNSPGPYWYQISSTGGREVVKDLMMKAMDAGYTGLVVTLDGPPAGNREADLCHGVVPPIQRSASFYAHIMAQVAARPRWAIRMLATLMRRKSIMSSTTKTLTSNAMRKSGRFTWSDIEWLKREWGGHVLVKGVLNGADALLAREAGADAIIVSNHGGRALDGVPSTISVLPEIIAAVGKSTEVLVDGGIRRASSIVKALSLGARAVLIGRPLMYGLACAGQPGVERVLEIFRIELVRTMKLLGCSDVAELDSRWLKLDILDQERSVYEIGQS